MLGGRRKLFEPIKIADVHIRNRIAVLALGLGYAYTGVSPPRITLRTIA
jgi:2,4-dienoyl-CoA reductase-like NADH-dependent reductase (Old Yellow Enzyme family)